MTTFDTKSWMAQNIGRIKKRGEGYTRRPYRKPRNPIRRAESIHRGYQKLHFFYSKKLGVNVMP